MKIYYVDSINGNDNNDGLTKETAYKSLKGLNSSSECHVFILLNDITCDSAVLDLYTRYSTPTIFIGAKTDVAFKLTGTCLITERCSQEDFLLFFNLTFKCDEDVRIYFNDEQYHFVYFYNCIIDTVVEGSYNNKYGGKLRFCNNLFLNHVTFAKSTPTFKQNIVSDNCSVTVDSATDLSSNVPYSEKNLSLLKDYTNIRNDISHYGNIDVLHIYKNLLISSIIKRKVKEAILTNQKIIKHVSGFEMEQQ